MPAATPIVTLSSQHDVAGNRTRLTDSVEEFRWLSYQTNAAGRLSMIRYEDDYGYLIDLVGLQYNDDDQLARITRGDPFLPQPISDYTYERATGRLARNTHHVQAGLDPVNPKWRPLLDEFGYSYDRDDRITRLAKLLDGTATYSYDTIDQLTVADRSGAAQDEAYAYDDAGNRLTSTVYGAAASYLHGTQYQQNRLLDDGTYTYLYNDEGTLQKRTLKSDTSKTSFPHQRLPPQRLTYHVTISSVDVLTYTTYTCTLDSYRLS